MTKLLGNMFMHTIRICLSVMKDVTLSYRVVTGTMTINLMKKTIFISRNSLRLRKSRKLYWIWKLMLPLVQMGFLSLSTKNSGMLSKVI
uniref:Uncharacterized protein n=1 Tax=Arundo donax TaxID=35708 RepID=A0A0A8ZXQ7_ARUDO